MLPIQLIVGLANPGPEYEDTRHNAGAWFIKNIVESENARLRHESKYHGWHTHIKLSHHAFHVLIPATYMNQSGQSVSACMRYNKLSPEAILIAHDDIDLPVGTVRLKFDGGDGGHNGLKDVIRHLHTKQFYRLRIGVGHPGNSKDVVNYVLKNPSKADRQKIDAALAKAQDILPTLLKGEMQKAMQQLHTEEEE